MQQQVNLYKYLPTHREFKIKMEQTVIVYCVFVLFLLLDMTAGLWHRHVKSRELAEVTQQYIAEKQKLDALTQQYPALNPEDLEKSMAQLQKDLDTKAKLVALLASGAHFSDDLKALASISVPGFWLTDININNDTAQVSLKGQALHSGDIQEFLREIVKVPEYKDRNLDLRDLTQAQIDKPSVIQYLNFSLATKVAE